MENFFPKTEDKSDKKAVEFRKTGNIKYQGGKLTFALVDYNKSIAFGKTKEVIALGYANRSAVYFELKRYEDCTKNIEWALENNYPEDKAVKLIDRKEKCERLMQTESHEDLWDFFKLSYPPNKKIPWIVDCIELRSNLQGEHEIFATKDLKAGDIISIEKPIAPMMTENSCYGRCYNCGKAAFLNLIPCDKSASIMFCSPKCKNECYEKAAVVQNKVDGITRVIQELVYLADNRNENLEDMIKSTNWDDPKMKKSVFDYDWNDSNDPKRKENILKCCLSIRKNSIAKNLFKSRADFDNTIEKFFSAPSKIISTSMQLFYGTTFNYHDMIEEIEIGSYIATTLFTNLINHSCTPNAIAFSVDNKIVTVLLAPVKKFEQIFLCHPMERTSHKFSRKCQICNTIPKPTIDTIDAVPIILIREKNFTVLKAWIDDTLKSINNSPVKYNHWDRLPTNFEVVMVYLGFLCAFPQ